MASFCRFPLRSLAFLALACSGPVEEVSVHGDEPPYAPEGEPKLEVGFYVEQLYRPLNTDDAMPIIYGLQGGTWTMPALRIQGIATPVELLAKLVTADNEVLGEVRASARFVLATDGWLEVQALPIPVERQTPNENQDVSELFGVSATLTISVEDEAGRSAKVTLAVVLSEG